MNNSGNWCLDLEMAIIVTGATEELERQGLK